MNNHGSNYSTPTVAFKSVMLFNNMNQIKIERGIPPTVGEFNCKTNPLDPLQTPPFMASIACGFGASITQYTFVHELGHVFKHRTTQIVTGVMYPCFDDGTTKSFNQCMQNPDPQTGNRSLGAGTAFFVFGLRGVGYRRDDIDILIGQFSLVSQSRYEGIDYTDFGPYNDPTEDNPNADRRWAAPADWLRGIRGWGSEAAYIGSCGAAVPSGLPAPSNFQQNACEVYEWLEAKTAFAANLGVDKVTEIEEAGADMFLNWVYITLQQGGFMNLDWTNKSCGANGNQACADNETQYGVYPPDSGLQGPGSDRHRWMDERLTAYRIYYTW